MKTHQLTCSIMLFLVAGGTGYCLRSPPENSVSVRPTLRTPVPNQLLAVESFSEIENAKEALEALASQFIIESRLRRSAGCGKSAASSPARKSMLRSHLPEAIKELEQGIEEFKGTDQELILVKELLWLLKTERFYDRWIEVYLNVLYQHPTHKLVGRFANEAILMGRAAGREKDVLNGFRHLSAIPLEFEGKRPIEAALIQAGTESQFARNDRDHFP